MIKINELEKKLSEADYMVTELLNLIEYYADKKDIENICCDLQDIAFNTYWQEDIDDAIKTIRIDNKTCPKCGEKLVYDFYLEKHYELDGYNDLEEIGYLKCEKCNYSTTY